MSRRTVAAVSTALVLLLGGCGSDDKEETPAETQAQTETETGAAVQQDAEAKKNARSLVTELEACFVDQQDYSACQEPEGSALPLGGEPGQVEVTEADAAEFTIVAHSESGNEFTITKGAEGELERTCEAAGSEEGGCSEGTW